MPQGQDHGIVLFADIARSTQIYERLGDRRAQKLMDTCLSRLSEATRRHRGELIKTIGDEVMCTFRNVDDAIAAAVEMNQKVDLRSKKRGVDSLSLDVAIFQISETFLEKYGYPAMTPGLRAKIFGLNATRPYGIQPVEIIERARGDELYLRRQAYRRAPNPHFLTYGPKTRREFLRLARSSGGRPA